MCKKYSQCIFQEKKKRVSLSFFFLRLVCALSCKHSSLLVRDLSVRSTHLDLSSSRAKKKKKVSTFVARALFSPRRKNTRSRSRDPKFKRFKIQIQNSNEKRFKIQTRNLPNNRCACARAQELPPPLAVALIFETYFALCCLCVFKSVCVLCVVEKSVVLCCVLFSLHMELFFFCFFGVERKDRGVLKILSPASLSQNLIRFAQNPKKRI